MLVDTHLPTDLRELAEATRRAKDSGFDGIFSAEVTGDPLVAAAAATQHAADMDFGTKIAVAFARTPMTMAYAANDVHELSGGRFFLGLGTQVKAHVTRRFSMPWGRPAAQMREFVLAMKEIWHSWRTDERLAHRGEFYHHTLMTPYFTPEITTAAPPAVWLAAVGPRMAATAAEVADGIVLHGFWTREYLDAVLMPAIEQGLARAGRTRSDLAITAGGFLITGADERELAAVRESVRYQVAFYGSTPAYRPVFDVHGLGELGDRLHALSVESSKDRWQRMTALIGDDVLDLFAVTAEPAGVAAAMLDRHADYADRIALPPQVGDPDVWSAQIAALRAGGGGAQDAASASSAGR